MLLWTEARLIYHVGSEAGGLIARNLFPTNFKSDAANNSVCDIEHTATDTFLASS